MKGVRKAMFKQRTLSSPEVWVLGAICRFFNMQSFHPFLGLRLLFQLFADFTAPSPFSVFREIIFLKNLYVYTGALMSFYNCCEHPGAALSALSGHTHTPIRQSGSIENISCVTCS